MICIISHTELSVVIASSIWVLVILTTVLAVTVAVGLIYFAGTQCRRKSRGQLLYDAPYNYELPPLPPHIQRTDSGIYDTISNSSKDGQQNQPQEQSESKPLDSKIDNEFWLLIAAYAIHHSVMKMAVLQSMTS